MHIHARFMEERSMMKERAHFLIGPVMRENMVPLRVTTKNRPQLPKLEIMPTFSVLFCNTSIKPRQNFDCSNCKMNCKMTHRTACFGPVNFSCGCRFSFIIFIFLQAHHPPLPLWLPPGRSPAARITAELGRCS